MTNERNEFSNERSEFVNEQKNKDLGREELLGRLEDWRNHFRERGDEEACQKIMQIVKAQFRPPKTLQKLASDLGVELWKAMEIAKQARPKVTREKAIDVMTDIIDMWGEPSDWTPIFKKLSELGIEVEDDQEKKMP